MRLVLKYNDDIKLLVDTIDYDSIVDFANTEFNIRPDSLELSFLDEDNDNITLLSNEDVEVMLAVFQGKEYVKIIVQGEQTKPQIVKKVDPVLIEEVPIQKEVAISKVIEEPIEQKQEPVKVQEVKIEESHEIPKQQEKQVKEEKEEKEVVPKEENLESSCQEWKKRKYQRKQCFLNETVAKLVDQRIKALLPCLKEQILGQVNAKQESNGVVHEGFECKGCLKKPIVGIRYECPTCPQFSLCEACEAKVDHEHNLLKIKKIVEKKEEEENGQFEHCFGRMRHGHGHGHGHHHRHGRDSSSSKEKCYGRGPHWFMKKCWMLSSIFGGRPEDYKQFVNENDGLKPRETCKRYANLQQMPEEEFKQKFIDMRAQKLSSSFGKPSEEYKKFVEENYELSYRELIHILKDNGESFEGRKCWGGKRFNFHEYSSPEKRECPFKKEKKVEVEAEVEVKPEKVEEPKKEEPKKEEIVVTESLLAEPKKDTAEVIRQKGAILIEMQEIFGKQNTKEYYRFIDAHFQEGSEVIIQSWIDSQSKLRK